MSILIIEDNDDVRATLADILICMGHKVHVAIHGHDALETLGRIPVPQLIILDVMMPVMDGPTFYKEFRSQKHFADVPVLIFSAGEEKVKLEGTAGHLKKPAGLDELMAFVDKYCV